MFNRLIKNKVELREARSSLNRVTHLLETYNTGLLTGYRKEDTSKVNKEKNEKIKYILRYNHLSWIDVQGTYIEDAELIRKQKSRQIDDNKSNPQNYDIMGVYQYEKSLLVIDDLGLLSNRDFYNLIEDLGTIYLQDSVIINIQGKNPILLGTKDTTYLKQGEFFDLTDRYGGEQFITYNSPSITVYSSLGNTAKLNIDNIFLNAEKEFEPSKKIFTIGQGLPIKPTEKDIETSDEEFDRRRDELLKKNNK